jgi:hypothetical protein
MFVLTFFINLKFAIAYKVIIFFHSSHTTPAMVELELS